MEVSGTLVICTRNRPADLRRTLESVSRQSVSFPLEVLVVDASDPDLHSASEAACVALGVRHAIFKGRPSLARQRNHALDLVAGQSDIILFVDDDVTLLDGYLEGLIRVFVDEPDVVGAGGSVRLDEPTRLRPPWKRLLRLAALQEAYRPGGVLPSGGESRAHLFPLSGRTPVRWLSGSSCAYRVEMASGLRFDPRLEGYSLDEDLDFSYRAGRKGRLLLEPAAVLVHHKSSLNRYEKERYAREHLIHRFWFVEKNVRNPLRKPAFWWATVLRWAATWLSADPDAEAVRRGLAAGMMAIHRRAHPLLKPSEGV